MTGIKTVKVVLHTINLLSVWCRLYFSSYKVGDVANKVAFINHRLRSSLANRRITVFHVEQSSFYRRSEGHHRGRLPLDCDIKPSRAALHPGRVGDHFPTRSAVEVFYFYQRALIPPHCSTWNTRNSGTDWGIMSSVESCGSHLCNSYSFIEPTQYLLCTKIRHCNRA